MGEHQDAEDQVEKDLNLHVAKLCEHFEWEATLPEQERHRRRFQRSIAGIARAAQAAAENDCPWILWGQIERIVHHADAVLGEGWREKACAQRAAWFEAQFGAEGDDL